MEDKDRWFSLFMLGFKAFDNENTKEPRGICAFEGLVAFLCERDGRRIGGARRTLGLSGGLLVVATMTRRELRASRVSLQI
uniref:Uncharacterized protein n=1 Tax=Cannabis sativa TaxID=3483 RepID=A0A803P6X5_CANSA